VDDWSHLKRVVSLVSSSVRQMVNEDELAVEVIASGLHGQINYWGRLKPEEISQAEKVGRSVGCAAVLGRPWAVLSQGERQRVLIGRALIANPELLILDEPCAGLDPAAREQFLSFLDQLAVKKNGPALILVTHHVEEITPGFTHVLAEWSRAGQRCQIRHLGQQNAFRAFQRGSACPWGSRPLWINSEGQSSADDLAIDVIDGRDPVGA
jgi:ABC-type molybdenum transport system ATPase subunit/photorepair protein PhrA